MEQEPKILASRGSAPFAGPLFQICPGRRARWPAGEAGLEVDDGGGEAGAVVDGGRCEAGAEVDGGADEEGMEVDGGGATAWAPGRGGQQQARRARWRGAARGGEAGRRQAQGRGVEAAAGRRQGSGLVGQEPAMVGKKEKDRKETG
ncbi:hypothetical protein SEVIR_9G466150v4 [Setaria viridis]